MGQRPKPQGKQACLHLDSIKHRQPRRKKTGQRRLDLRLRKTPEKPSARVFGAFPCSVSPGCEARLLKWDRQLRGGALHRRAEEDEGRYLGFVHCF